MFNKGITQPPRSGKTLEGIPDNIDIITGMLKEDNPEGGQDMTEEEKEEEAQKLFEMIHRLNQNGVIKMVPKYLNF